MCTANGLMLLTWLREAKAAILEAVGQNRSVVIQRHEWMILVVRMNTEYFVFSW